MGRSERSTSIQGALRTERAAGRGGGVRIAMIGTRGVPARYGGFETAVEEVGARLAERGHDVVVYCRNPGQRLHEHRGMRLVNLPAVRVRAGETLSHAAASAAHAVVRGRPDVALLFNAANAPVVPALQRSGIPVAVHVDGLEWERAKWAGTGARYYRWAARRSAMWADEVIVDSRAVGEVVHRLFGRDGTFLPYGAPLLHPEQDQLAAVGFAPRNCHLVVARIKPENHVVEIVQGYRSSAATHPLVVVGDTPYSDAYDSGCAGPQPATSASGCSAASGTRTCSTSSTAAPRPTCTATPSAAPTPRCSGRWAPAPR